MTLTLQPLFIYQTPNEQPIKLALNKDQKKTIKNNLKIKKIKKITINIH